MSKTLNTNLHSAKKQKNDEFYTQLSDIEREMWNYKKYFTGKTVYCNCDDPYESNFFKYFALNFDFLGLKKLIATCYVGSPIANKQLSLFDDESAENKTTKSPHKIEITEIPNIFKEKAVGLDAVKLLLSSDKNHLTRLKGNGDFRSKECKELLKEADIVVTNPPFSLFREFVVQLIENNKNFVIIGSKNAITYKEIFRYIKENKIWLGTGFANGNAYFEVENPRDFASGVYDEKTGLVKFRNVGWFTNLDFKERHDNLILFRRYNETDYPKYDNYDAIEVSKIVDIPVDYDGVMGVPITFMDNYNPEQFELIGMGEDNGSGFSGGVWNGGSKSCLVKGKAAFKRLFIKKR